MNAIMILIYICVLTGALFLFGQTKRTGEANMYPKPVQDLSGMYIAFFALLAVAFAMHMDCV